MGNKKLIIVNAHWSNRGDEAALRAVLDKLKKDRPGWDFEIMFKDGSPVKEFTYSDVSFFSSKFLPRSIFSAFTAVLTKGKTGSENASMRESIEKMSEADMLVYSPGGAVICDRFWYVKQLEYLLPFICAKIYHIPIAVASPSFGPFDKEKNGVRNLIKKRLLSVPEKLCVREEISKSYLKRIGIEKNVIVTADSAFIDDFPDRSDILSGDAALARYFNKYDKIVGMTVTDFSWHVKYSKDKELTDRAEAAVHSVIDEMKKRNIGVLLIPQLFGNQNDTDCLKKYADSSTFILSDKYDTYVQQYIISKLYAVIGMRYHSNIFAAKAGVPFIAVSYEEKMTGFMNKYKFDDCMIPVQQFDTEAFMKTYAHLEDSYDEIKTRLSEHREEWRAAAMKAINIIEEEMDNA